MNAATLTALMRAYGLEVPNLIFDTSVRCPYRSHGQENQEHAQGWYCATRLADGEVAGAYGIGAPPLALTAHTSLTRASHA